MKQQKYVGVVDFRGKNSVTISNADLSRMTGAKGVKTLILENVTGLHGVFDAVGVETVIVKKADASKVSKFICGLNTKIEGLPKGWSGFCLYISSSEIMNRKIDELLEKTR